MSNIFGLLHEPVVILSRSCLLGRLEAARVGLGGSVRQVVAVVPTPSGWRATRLGQRAAVWVVLLGLGGSVSGKSRERIGFNEQNSILA